MIMDTNKAKASYGVGMSIAESLSQQDLTALDLDQVMAGMHAIFSGIEPLMSPEEANIWIEERIGADRRLVQSPCLSTTAHTILATPPNSWNPSPLTTY